MRKLLNNPAFVGVLALAALVFVGWSVLAKPDVALPAAPDGDAVDAVGAEDGEAGVDVSNLSIPDALKALSIPALTRDPFAIPAKPENEASSSDETAAAETIERVRLSAIWVQGPAVYLLLNGKICTPGDRVGRFTVETAEIAGALIGFPGGSHFLSVGQELAVKITEQGLTTPLFQ